MTFETRFPTRGTLHYGINDLQLSEIKSNIDQYGKDDILVIVEVDKDNNQAIKGIQIVRGNWFERTITWISKLFEELTSKDKAYHFGTDAVMQDLSAQIDQLSKEYKRLATEQTIDEKDIQYVLKSDSAFNQTINRINHFSSSFFSNAEVQKISSMMFDLCFHHDLAISHLKVRQTAEIINSSVAEGNSESEIDYQEELRDFFQHRRDLFARMEGTVVHFKNESKRETRMHQPTRSTVEIVEKDLEASHFLANLTQLAIVGKIDIQQLLVDVHREDPLKAKLEQISTLKNLAEKLDTLEQTENHVDFINAGIEFIEGFYSLETDIQDKSGLKQRFDAINFDEVATRHIKDLRKDIIDFKVDPEKIAEFSEKYNAFIEIMDGLKEARSKISRQEMSGIQKKLDKATQKIGLKLSSLKAEQLKVLQEKYREESVRNERELQKLKETQEELVSAQKDTKRLEALHQELVNTISSGKDTDVARLLTVPAQEAVEPEVKNLVFALQAVVKQARLEESDIKHQDQRIQELDRLLATAGLPPIPTGTSAISYINNIQVVKKVGAALQFVKDDKIKAEKRAATAKEEALKAKTEADTPKGEVIEAKRRELENIALIEIRLLRKALGMTKQRPHATQERDQELQVNFNDLAGRISPAEMKPSEAEAQAEVNLNKLVESLRVYYESRYHIAAIAEKALDDAESSSPESKFSSPDSKYQMALLEVADEMLKRRDALAKEVKEFESLQHPEFYTLQTRELKEMLEIYQKKYQLPHLIILGKDLIVRAREIHASGGSTETINAEQFKILELVEAYKHKLFLDEKANRLGKVADQKSAAVHGWDNLASGLDHLLQTASSYKRSEEATAKVGNLAKAVEAADLRREALMARQRVIAARQDELGRLLEAQTDLIGAQAVQGMMDQITLYQTD